MTEKDNKYNKRKKLRWFIPLLAVVLIGIIFLVYTEQYYHADESAYPALKSDENVNVVQTEFGWLFDGASETDAIIFYPGGKVEETAYAPLLHNLAAQGMDAFLVQMPFRLAVFGMNKAEYVQKKYNYEHWFIGGHSLGGTMAADYAAEHSSDLCGVYLLAAYPTKPLDEKTPVIIIYGTEDGILNMEKMTDAKKYIPEGSREYVIEGGNHAQFGNYGKQDGDGNASISSNEQQDRTIELLLQNR